MRFQNFVSSALLVMKMSCCNGCRDQVQEFDYIHFDLPGKFELKKIEFK